MEPAEEAAARKAEGNAAFKEKRFADAVQSYGEAIALDPANAVLCAPPKCPEAFHHITENARKHSFKSICLSV